MKLMIGMPVQDNVPGAAFNHHIAVIVEASKLMTKKYPEADPESGNLFTLTPVGLSPHDTARWLITKAAMDMNCERLFMMDDDTITPRGGITKLMEEMDNRQCAAISGFYLRRGYPYTPVWSATNPTDKKLYQVDADQGVHEIFSSGLGCCLIDLKWCRENIKDPWYKMKQTEHNTEITDDCVFFDAIRAAGGTLLGDADVQCPHVGRAEFITRESASFLRGYGESLEKLGLVKSLKGGLL